MGLALVGFGEAGKAFAKGWEAEGVAAPLAFDIAGGVAAHGVRLAGRSDVLRGAEAVVCLVTADAALAAAEACAGHLAQGALWFDGNSCAPATKRRAEAVIGAAGACYVDMAIMAPVHPALHRTPVLLSGPEAAQGAAVLAALGMRARVVGEEVGQASSIKMLRSVMVKGMEALFAECFLGARRAGVEGEVIASLVASTPEIDWFGQGGYALERMMSHGVRRAAEMREVGMALRDLGFAGEMTAAVAAWQDRIGRMGMTGAEGDLWTRADLVLARL